MKPSDQRPILDESVIQALRGFSKPGRPDFLIPLITVFSETVPEIFNQIQSAASSGDRKLLAHAAHTLKSSSANVGALRLSESCLTLEKMGDGALPIVDLSVALLAFNEEFRSAMIELNKLKSSV